MLSLIRAMKVCAAIVVTAIILTGIPSRSYADTGSVRLKITKVGFIVGVGGGSGTLTFKGKNYRLSIGGVSAGTIGVAGGIGWYRLQSSHRGRHRRYLFGPLSRDCSSRRRESGNATELERRSSAIAGTPGWVLASLSVSGLTISLQ